MIDPNDDRTHNEKDLTMIVKRLLRKIEKLSPEDPIIHETIMWLGLKRFIRATDMLRHIAKTSHEKEK